MIDSAWNNRRRLVPRWRSLEQTARAGELSSARRPSTQGNPWSFSPEHTERVRQWRLTPSLISAAELVESAIVEGHEFMALDAARRIVHSEPHAAPLVRRQARDLLERNGHARELPEEPAQANSQPVAYWRARTRLNPGDALAWVELSLNHTIRSHLQHAHRDMRIAVQLAPDNRHVLRSAARLLLHMGRPEEAHDLLLRSPATKTDPWLLAAEISISEVSERASRLAKVGRSMLDNGGISPRQMTELAGAVATLEMVNGAHKRSRKLFGQSLRDPTGNSLAQAEWATPFIGATMVSESSFTSVMEASEATAFHAYMREDYGAVPPACEMWATEEPYSIRPFEFGAAVASFGGDHEQAVNLAMRGLSMRPGAPKLVGTLVFCHASTGNLDDAEKLLDAVDWTGADETSQYVALANRGLIAFRRGLPEEGRARYNAAISGFQRAADRGSAAAAKIYLAREEALLGQPGANRAIEEAAKAWTQVYGKRQHPALAAAIDALKEPRPGTNEPPTWSARAKISYRANLHGRGIELAPSGEGDD